jgi:hypothetical protein
MRCARHNIDCFRAIWEAHKRVFNIQIVVFGAEMELSQ